MEQCIRTEWYPSINMHITTGAAARTPKVREEHRSTLWELRLQCRIREALFDVGGMRLHSAEFILIILNCELCEVVTELSCAWKTNSVKPKQPADLRDLSSSISFGGDTLIWSIMGPAFPFVGLNESSLARECKIPDPSLLMTSSTFTLRQEYRVVL
jgi:hypothetical protein